MVTQLRNNIETVHRRVSHAAMKAGRDPGEVKLVAVTKTVRVEQIREAVGAGLRVFGENRVQEAQKKILSEELRGMNEKIDWHLIGPLQKNKVKHAVQLFDLIHSVDSIELALEINKHSERTGKAQRVLVEVKLSPEDTKHGVDRRNLMPVLSAVSSMKCLILLGLMTIPPFSEDPEDARRYFRELRELRDAAQDSGIPLPELSMGMSNDFEVAIEEGATLVRVGTAIFGERK